MKDSPDRIKVNYVWHIIRFSVPIVLIITGIMLTTQVFAKSMNYDPRVVGKPLFIIMGRPVCNPIYYFLSMFKFIFYKQFHKYYLNSIVYFLYCGICAFIFSVIWTLVVNIVINQKGTFHGTADFADEKTLKKKGLMKTMGVVCGEVADAVVDANEEEDSSVKLKLIKPGKLVCHLGKINTFLLAPSGSGKGVGVILPTLYSYGQPVYKENGKLKKKGCSMVIFDPKGENYNLTAGWRSSFSHIIKFSPVSNNTHRFNPIAEIRDGNAYAFRDCDLIADIIFAGDSKATENEASQYFKENGKSIIVGALMYVRFCDYPEKTLAGVRRFLAGANNLEKLAAGKGEANAELGKAQALAMANAHPYYTITQEMYDAKKSYYDKKGLGVGDKIESEYVKEQLKKAAADILSTNAKERASTWKTIAGKIRLFDDESIDNVTSGHDFSIDDFRNSDKPITLYLTIPYGDIVRIAPVFKLLISFMLKRFTDGETQFGQQPLKHDIMFLLDEFPVLGNFSDIPLTMGIGRGYGLFFMIVCQSLNQIIDRYGPNHPFLDHCPVHIIYAPGKIEDAKMYSDSIGQETVHQTKVSRNGKVKLASDSNLNYSDNDMGRALLDPADIKRLPKDKFLLMAHGMQPYIGTKVVYYMDERFKHKMEYKAPDTMDKLYSEVAGLPSQMAIRKSIEYNKWVEEHTREVHNEAHEDEDNDLFDLESDKYLEEIAEKMKKASAQQQEQEKSKKQKTENDMEQSETGVKKSIVEIDFEYPGESGESVPYVIEEEQKSDSVKNQKSVSKFNDDDSADDDLYSDEDTVDYEGF